MPSNLQVKNSIKVIFKDLNLPKGFAVQLRCPAKNASDMTQTFLPLVQGVAGAIPIAGPPMQAAIGGLLSILQLIDRRSQNKADLDHLALQLHRLSSHLCNAPTAQDSLEQYRRDSIIGILQETSTQLTRLQKRRPEYASITQAIATCSSEIDHYLLDSLVQWSFQMQQNQTMQGPAVTQLTAAIKLGCVTLVDATGHEHAISLTLCSSFQRQYMEQGQYNLCIDDDKQVTQLTNHEWPSIEAGTTIVMRVVFEEEKDDFGVKHKCHFCGAVNHIDNKYSLQRHAGSSINCQVCKRRFQISHERSLAEQSTQSSDIDSDSRTEAEMHLIRDFYVQRTFNASTASKYGYNRFKEIEGSSSDDDGDNEAENSDYELSANDSKEWEDCDDGEDFEEMN
ncbi:hypothetical protein BDR07DRAFT_1583796 [Suillus spraguei]|nr:hypothetical protein BDR07DRAFT_1583796 [Suillus spraguei]